MKTDNTKSSIQSIESLPRRKLVQALWKTPLVMAVTLPVHAQVTPSPPVTPGCVNGVSGSLTFNSIGSSQTFVVPDMVCEINLELIGAGGASQGLSYLNVNGPTFVGQFAGGNGEEIILNSVPVTAGEIFEVYVGLGGIPSLTLPAFQSGAGGWGLSSGTAGQRYLNVIDGAGGGGSSAISRSGSILGEASGGGGAGFSGTFFNFTLAGGQGGGPSGGNGGNNSDGGGAGNSRGAPGGAVVVPTVPSHVGANGNDGSITISW